MIILLDTETTDLLKPVGTNLIYQPHIIELFALKVTKKGKIVDSWYSLFKPPLQIPYYITKITGIDDTTVEDAPIFRQKYKSLKKFFKGSKVMVAHNLPFDKGMINVEAQRIGRHKKKIKPFPWPKEDFCTIQESLHIKGFRLTLKELYFFATGNQEIENAHRADSDVYAMLDCYQWLQEQIK